jgi:site-specific recombinase XerD
MTYQYKREPLAIEEADRLFSVADSLQEKLCVYGLLETGLRVSKLAELNKQQIQWQQGAIRTKGKGGEKETFVLAEIENQYSEALPWYMDGDLYRR